MTRYHLAVGRTVARDRTVDNVRIQLVRADMRRAELSETAIFGALTLAAAALVLAVVYLV